MKILVTGGTGFAGSALTRRLLGLGHEVHALDNKAGVSDRELQDLGARIHYGSVTDRELVGRVATGCDRVFHLAAAFRLVNLGKREYWDINVRGTETVLDAARDRDVPRVINCSTCGVHGDVKDPPAAEDAPIAPADYYQYTKWEAEKLASQRAAAGQWVTTIRPTAIYGPGDAERFYLIYKRVAKGRFTFLGDGSVTYHPLYIDNLVDALLQASESDAAKGQSYLIADERYVTIKNLVESVSEAMGVDCKLRFLPFWPAYVVATMVELAYRPLPAEPPVFRRRLDWFRQNRAFDIGKAQRELGYLPRVALPEGLRRTAEWYRERGMI